jgi:hypothetical protein
MALVGNPPAKADMNSELHRAFSGGRQHQQVSIEADRADIGPLQIGVKAFFQSRVNFVITLREVVIEVRLAVCV